MHNYGSSLGLRLIVLDHVDKWAMLEDQTLIGFMVLGLALDIL